MGSGIARTGGLARNTLCGCWSLCLKNRRGEGCERIILWIAPWNASVRVHYVLLSRFLGLHWLHHA